MADKYALIIACSQYQDSRLRQLPKTEADAEGIKNVLVSPSICGFPEANVEPLIDEEEGRIKVVIERFFKNRQKDDLLLLYFAGHGIIDDHRRLTLALNKTDPDFRSTGIEARFLRDEMENSRCEQQIFILDCCNAGAFAKARDTKGSPAGFQETLTGKGRVVFAASDKLQFSFDEVEGREDIKNGVFTHYLIEGLRTFNAVGADGYTVTANSLYNYAHEKVTNATERRQTPVLILPTEKRIGEIVLARKPEVDLPHEIRSLLDDSDYTQRLRGIYKLRDAVRDGQDYANTANNTLRNIAHEREHREVHKAVDEVLKEVVGPEFTEGEQKHAATESVQEAQVGSVQYTQAASNRWTVPAALLVFVIVGLYFVFLHNGERTRLREDRNENEQSEPKTPTKFEQERIEALLLAAEYSHKNGAIETPSGNNALATYKEILELDPDNVRAQKGLSKIAKTFADKAERATAEKQWTQAEEYLAKAVGIDADLPELIQLRKTLEKARRSAEASLEQKRANQVQDAKKKSKKEDRKEKPQSEQKTPSTFEKEQFDSLVSAAKSKFNSRNLTIPRAGEESAALDDYRAVLQLDPKNTEARTGIRKIAEFFVSRTERAMVEGQWKLAADALEKAAEIDNKLPQLPQLRWKLAEARKPTGSGPKFKAGDQFRDKLKSGGLGPPMIVIPAGQFMMGSTKETDGDEHRDDERQHSVTIARSFALSQYESTVGEFREFVNDTGYTTTAERKGYGCISWKIYIPDKYVNWKNPGFEQNEKHPVVCVSWHDAVAYAEWLSQQTNEHYRLPTQTEWEYATRSGKRTRRYWGNDHNHKEACNYANVADSSLSSLKERLPTERHSCTDHYVFTAPVGGNRIANNFKLYDMLGNVSELTCSLYDKGYSGNEKDCVDKNDRKFRSLRGGSWTDQPVLVRAASQRWESPNGCQNDVGFRLARAL